MKFMESIAKNARSIIAILVVGLGFGFLFALLFKQIPEGNASVLNVASGIVLGVLGSVCAYYFGSSKDKSDSEKADIQTKIIEAEKKNGAYAIYNPSLAYAIGATMSKEGISYRCIVPIAAGEEFDVSKWEVVK